jgi:MFS family permease
VGKTVRLTDAGQTFQSYARTLLITAQQAKAALVPARAVSGTLRVALADSVCSTFLPDLLSGFPSLEPVSVAGYPRSLQPDQYFYSGLLMVGVLGQYVGGKATDRVPVELGLVVGYGGLAVLALAFLPVASLGLGPLAAVGAALGFFLFMVQPLYQATIAESTPPEARGLSYGYTYLGVFGIGALGGTVAGGVLTYFSPPALFLVLAAFATAAATLGGVLYRRR